MATLNTAGFEGPGRTWRVFWLAVLWLGLTAAGAWGADGEILTRQTLTVEASMLPESLSADDAAETLAKLQAMAAEVTVEAITYASDGLRVKGYLAYPKGAERSPCLVYLRGGNRDFSAHSPYSAFFRLGRLASKGYVVVAPQYRGVDGGEGQEEFGGAEIADVMHLLPLLGALPQADATRVGLFGWSRGGMMAYLALARTDRFKAAIVGAAPVELADLIADRPAMEERVLAQLVPGWQDNREQEIAKRSALRWPEKLSATTPILILHGSADWRVAPTQSLRMANALLEAKRPFRFILYEGGDHGLREYRDDVDEQVTRWLDHYVRDGQPWPSLEPHGR